MVGDVIQDRLVIFVHQHHDALAGAGVCRCNQFRETAGDVGGVDAGLPQGLGIDAQQGQNPPVQFGPGLREAGAEAQPDDRGAPRPVPAVMDGEAPKQRLVACEAA